MATTNTNTTSVTALIERLRTHAKLHEGIAEYDDEQLQWMKDLEEAATLLEAASSGAPSANASA